jgi:hypothetical protein
MHDYMTLLHHPGTRFACLEDMSAHLTGKQHTALCSGTRVGPDLLASRVVGLDRAGGNQLSDILDNMDRLFVVSERARDLLTSEGSTPEEVEFIPFQLKDKKGKARPERYAIANPLRKVECLDPSRSDAKLFSNPVDGSKEWMISALQIDVSKVPPDARLFRLAEDPKRILIRSDLVETIRAAGLTGFAPRALGQSLLG